ncbi:MAG TPA: geranylgeranyl reductase family protein [Anaerolineae bacterium]|nr:geranylgeranyl reductase family protein [Anaerolineae bacterium]
MNPTYDIAVIGAGPAGASTSYFLAQAGLNTLLIDKASFPRDKTCGDAVGPRSLGVITEMNLLDDLAAVGHRATHMSLASPNGKTFTDPIPQLPHDVPNYSIVIPRYQLDNILQQRAIAGGAHFRQGQVLSLDTNDDHVTLNLKKDVITARMAVIATGASFKLLQQTGILTHIPQVGVAARAYYDNVIGLQDKLEFFFQGIPLPGYGWIFPTSPTSANIGAGVFPSRQKQPSPRTVMENFLQLPVLQQMLANATPTTPIKGYPLRVDFATAPTYGRHILLVGEAAGLVNPISGEGIDYALESGQIAAHHLAQMFASDNFSPAQYRAYDRQLRDRFQKVFRFCQFISLAAMNKPFLNWLTGPGPLRDYLRSRIFRIALGDIRLRA